MNRGSCLCGDIRWEITGEPAMMSACHCSMCRKTHGAAFATYIGVPHSDFRWTAGEGKVQSYESSPGGARPFCPQCGSVVAFVNPAGASAAMPAGNMDGDWERRLESHIFVASKAPWYQITDKVPQFDVYPEGFGMRVIDTPPRPPATEGAIGGSCLCGAVAFEFDTTLGRMGYCHCSRCRRSRSAAHSAQTFVDLSQLRWVRGEERVRRFNLPESEFFFTSFCDTCGSLMPNAHTDRGMATVPAGALDQDPGIRPQGHIYVGSMAPWFEITDDLPQFEELPDT